LPDPLDVLREKAALLAAWRHVDDLLWHAPSPAGPPPPWVADDRATNALSMLENFAAGLHTHSG
jgi:hypothetical protein